jgi:hypothetical protein
MDLFAFAIFSIVVIASVSVAIGANRSERRSRDRAARLQQTVTIQAGELVTARAHIAELTGQPPETTPEAIDLAAIPIGGRLHGLTQVGNLYIDWSRVEMLDVNPKDGCDGELHLYSGESFHLNAVEQAALDKYIAAYKHRIEPEPADIARTVERIGAL